MHCLDEPTTATDAHAWFFNRDVYQRHNGVADAVVRVEHHDGDRIVGSLTGVVADGAWTSGHRAPYGGMDIVKASEPFASLAELARSTRIELAARGVGTLRVRCRPNAYGRTERGAVHALLDAGFAVERCHVNHHIDVAALADVDDYLRGLSASARNMVRRGEALGLELQDAVGDVDWAEGYEVLQANKQAKGRSMSIGLDYLLGLRDAAPDVPRMVVLRQAGGAACAAALTYRVGPGVELVVAWGDADHELPRSPMNLLALRLVERALAEGVGLLDLGISSDGAGLLNPGLAFFKESVGARPDLRFDLVLEGT